MGCSIARCLAFVADAVIATVINVATRVESGSDDLDSQGHLGHFLIHKLNYLDVTLENSIVIWQESEHWV